MRILIAQPDALLCTFLRDGLESEHYEVDVSHRGDEACSRIGEIEYKVVLLGLDLPGMEGLAVLKRARITRPSLPVLILSARSEIADRVQCLDAGADDYITKPFSFLELSARIRAVLRRSHLPSDAVLMVGDLKLHRVERRVERAGKRIDLTSKEFSLLEYLMCNAGRHVTRDMIIEHVWNFNLPTAATNVVDVYINYKAKHVGDLVRILIMQDTTASNSANVGTDRSFKASSGIDALPGQISTSGVQNLFSPHSSQTLQGKAQANTKSTLRTSLAGTVVAVLNGGALVVEAERSLTMNNERQTVILRGVARAADVAPDNSVLSNQLSNLELELKGKGVISDGTRPPNVIVRLLLRVLGF
jgi:two-component system, OmpR family, copper resistance phosphate regulon response regulator CusR